MRFLRQLAIIVPSIGVVACTALLGDFSVAENGSTNGDDGGGDTGEGSANITIAVAPLDSKIGVLRSQAFTATGGDVTWSLQEGAMAGTIDAAGLYVSGSTPGTYHVVATSKVDPSKSASVAIIVVNLGLQVLLGQNGGRGNIDGTAKRAHFNGPQGIAHLYDNGNNDQQFFIADTGNHTIRGYSSKSGKVTTLAGASGTSGSADGIGNVARFNEPRMLAMDSTIRRLFVADANGTCIRFVDVMTGNVRTVAGVCGTTGSSDGLAGMGGNPPTPATFQNVQSIALSGDKHSALYVCDSGSLRRIELVNMAAIGTARTITPSQQGCNPLVVDYWNGGFTDKTIYYGENLSLNKITEVATWPSGLPVAQASITYVGALPDYFDSFAVDYQNLYASSQNKGVIYRMQNVNGASPMFDATPWAGAVNDRRTVDGPLQTARFGSPSQIVWFQEYGDILVADARASAIREIRPNQSNGTVETPVGAAHVIDLVDGARQMARITGPFSLASDDKGLIYFGDINFDGVPANSTIRKYDRTAQIASTLAGVPTEPFDNLNPPVDGPKDQARFWFPIDMTFVKGNLYVVDSLGQAVRKVDTATGAVSTLAGEKTVPGTNDGVGTAAHFKFVDFGSGSGGSGASIFGGSITTDGTFLYVSDSGSFTIRKIAIATGEVTTIAGGVQGNQNGTGKAAQFVFPMGITFDNGSLYIADWQDHTIRRMNLMTNVVDTFIGLSGQQGNVDGDAATATLNSPFRLIADGLGNLYVSELPITNQGQPSGLIRRIDIKGRKISPFAGTAGQVGLQPAPIPSTLNCPTALSITAQKDLVYGDFCEASIAIFQPL